MQTLLIHRGSTNGSPEGHQIHGFSMYRNALRRRLGMEVEGVQAMNLEAIEETIRDSEADLAIVMVDWKDAPDRVESMFARLRSDGVRPKLVFLDYYAPSSSPHFGVLPYVDRFVKRQVLRDRSLYQRDLAGGCLFTDHLAATGRYELNGWHFGEKPRADLMHKVVSGWNLGVSPLYRRILSLSRSFPIPWNWRNIAIHRRIQPGNRGTREWYEQYRDEAGSRLDVLGSEYRCTGGGRVRRSTYLRELAFSKLVISPFGWGEVCFRDYEAIAAGALLVKPSMSHLVTSPNIYVDGVTYVAVKWDLSDLVEKCQYYLAHPDEAQAIAANAQAALAGYFEGEGFVKDISRALEGLVEPAFARACPIPA